MRVIPVRMKAVETHVHADRRLMGKGGHEVPVALPAPARAILRDYLATDRIGEAPARRSSWSGTRAWVASGSSGGLVGSGSGSSSRSAERGRGCQRCIRTRSGTRPAQNCIVGQGTCVACRNSCMMRTFRRLRFVPGSRSRTCGRRWKRSTTRARKTTIQAPPPRGTKFGAKTATESPWWPQRDSPPGGPASPIPCAGHSLQVPVHQQ